MRLLPRSARGTWLLAAAVWGASCAGVWWLLAVAPRAEWTLAEPSRLDFLPGGDELVTRIVGLYPLGDFVNRARPQPDGPTRVWDARSGRLLRTYPAKDETAPHLDRSLPTGPPGTESEAVSPDGKALAAIVRTGDTLREVGVWEVGSLRRLKTVPLPSGVKEARVGLSSAGTILAAAYLIDVQRKKPVVICWETATGRELLRVTDAWEMVLSSDGDTLLTTAAQAGDGGYSLSVWDVRTGRKRFAVNLMFNWVVAQRPSALLSPDGRTIAAPIVHAPADPVGDLARRFGVPWPLDKPPIYEVTTLFDSATGRELGRLPGQVGDLQWSPDSTLLATLDRRRHLVRVWDIPPRKPLTWFALAAAVLALPLAGLARWRSRRLRRGVASIAP